MKSKVKKHKKVNRYSKGEFLFNFISICLMIALGIFIGYRSLYYYSKQTAKSKEVVNTLAGVVLASNRVTDKDNGFHQEEDGYIFRGIVDNNYIKFAGRIFRIIKVNSDNTVKVASMDSQAIISYGDNSLYEDSNIYNWLNKTEKKYSGIYQSSIPGVEELLVKTPWCKGELINNKVECNEEKGEDYFTLLTLDDYIDTLGKNSYLNTRKNNWVLGKNADGSNLYIAEGGSVVSTDNYESFGTIVVFTFKKDIKVSSGTGTLGDPYVIYQEGHDNNIEKFVKLGNDMWRVYSEDETSVNLVLNDYIKDQNGNDLLLTYSEENDSFNPLNRDNIAYYLNRTYFNSLSYKELLGECIFHVGEISFSNGLDYENMYTDSISNKVGLLNSFDINTNSNLTDYFLMNTTSSVGSMAYVYKNNNTLEEVRVNEEKKVVPTICIGKYLFVGGTGTVEDPFVVE